MKILHILNTPRAEGTPNIVLDWLATGLHKQEVYVLHAEPADLSDKLRNTAAWYGESMVFHFGISKFILIALNTWRVCRARNPDVIICWPTGFANWICWGAKLAGVKNLLVHAGNPAGRGFKKDWITRYVMWPLFATRAQVICCSEYVRKTLIEVPGMLNSRFHAIANCSRSEETARRAQIKQNQSRSDSKTTGIMVATLESHKDHETLLRAVPKVLEQVQNFNLNLVGDGSLRPALDRLTDELNIRHAVNFLGSRLDVPELLGQSDCFIFSTTNEEGLGSVLIEALAVGLPIVASNVPACREMLDNGKWGTLVEAGNHVALAEQIIKTLNDGPLEDSIMKRDRRKYASQFSAEKMINLYLEQIPT